MPSVQSIPIDFFAPSASAVLAVADPLGGKSYYFNPQYQPAGTATPAWNQPTVLGSGWTTDGSYCPSCQRRGR